MFLRQSTAEEPSPSHQCHPLSIRSLCRSMLTGSHLHGEGPFASELLLVPLCWERLGILQYEQRMMKRLELHLETIHVFSFWP